MSTIKFNKKIDKLSMEVLKHSGIYREYTDEDLSNVTLIFTEVFVAKMYDKHSKKLGQQGMEKLAAEAGESLRQTIKVFTGIDLHKVYKK